MKKLLILSLGLAIFPVQAEEEEKTITYKLGGKEYTVTESENPELAKFMEKIESIAKQQKEAEEGKPETPPAAVTEAPPPRPSHNATPQSAESLYNEGNFEKAYEHYKELSAQGDDEASLMLAIMHSKGQGVEADEAAAHAWFTRSAEQGNSSAGEFIQGSRLTNTEKEKSLNYYNDISKEFDEPEKAESAMDRYQQVQSSSYARTQPAIIDRTDQSSLKVKTYRRDPAGSFDNSPAKSYESAPAKSYGHGRFVLEKKY